MIDLTSAKIINSKTVHKNRFNADLSEVESIKWLYKISPNTADFRRGDEIEEIQVFSVVFKNGTVNKRCLLAIQKAIPYPILFIAHGKYYVVADGDLLESDRQFVDGDTLMIDKRSAKLTDLHYDIIAAFVPIAPRPNELITELVGRYKRLVALDREIAAMQRKVDAEKQPNKRIELNEELRRVKLEKEELTEV